MRKQNGYVFMETIVVVSVLSLTLLILFSSYSYILRKSRARNTFDTTEMIYKTYHVKSVIDSYNTDTSTKGIVKYIQKNPSICKQMGSYNSYVCDLSSGSYNGDLIQIKKAFEVEKFYYLNPHEVLNSPNKAAWLNLFDATTIDYINNLGLANDYNILLVKYKKQYGKNDGTYEIFHASVEV